MDTCDQTFVGCIDCWENTDAAYGPHSVVTIARAQAYRKWIAGGDCQLPTWSVPLAALCHAVSDMLARKGVTDLLDGTACDLVVQCIRSGSFIASVDGASVSIHFATSIAQARAANKARARAIRDACKLQKKSRPVRAMLASFLGSASAEGEPLLANGIN